MRGRLRIGLFTGCIVLSALYLPDCLRIVEPDPRPVLAAPSVTAHAPWPASGPDLRAALAPAAGRRGAAPEPPPVDYVGGQ